MSIVLWAVLALLVGLVALVLGARRLAAVTQAAPGEPLPPTRLQLLARWTLIVGLAVVVVAAGVVAWFGPDRFYEAARVRIPVTVLLLLALVVFAAFALQAARWASQAGGPLDERDRAIFEKAPTLEGTPMIIVLAIWLVGLQETFWSAGAVPLVYLYLVFWSLLLVKAMALPIGVLIGYRRS